MARTGKQCHGDGVERPLAHGRPGAHPHLGTENLKRDYSRTRPRPPLHAMELPEPDLNLEPRASAVPQNEGNADFLPNRIGAGEDLIVQAANDWRGNLKPPPNGIRA